MTRTMRVEITKPEFDAAMRVAYEALGWCRHSFQVEGAGGRPCACAIGAVAWVFGIDPVLFTRLHMPVLAWLAIAGANDDAENKAEAIRLVEAVRW